MIPENVQHQTFMMISFVSMSKGKVLRRKETNGPLFLNVTFKRYTIALNDLFLKSSCQYLPSV